MERIQERIPTSRAPWSKRFGSHQPCSSFTRQSYLFNCNYPCTSRGMVSLTATLTGQQLHLLGSGNNSPEALATRPRRQQQPYRLRSNIRTMPGTLGTPCTPRHQQQQHHYPYHHYSNNNSNNQITNYNHRVSTVTPPDLSTAMRRLHQQPNKRPPHTHQHRCLSPIPFLGTSMHTADVGSRTNET